ncbi:MAG: SusC/RagA family TonB-linked outer membrane protein [Dysgonamonadaceae bacterium]|jgi:TonB-linked SusC/RagA family outer membrane protein|nr:SusC/RagA family TonB-linked outer membrane protein [Dysgonamonadaceae bacterium]
MMIKLHNIFRLRKLNGKFVWLSLFLFFGIGINSGITYAQDARRKIVTDSVALSTGNTGKIESDVIEQEQGTRTVNALKGRVSGVEVENGKIKIRGQSNVTDKLSEPLVIIDGVQLPSGFSWSGEDRFSPLNLLNSSSIESIEILKDADATAIYGGKGANGVVVIKTKKILEQKLRISASVAAGITGIDSWYDFLSTGEYLDIRAKALAADNITPTETNAYDLLLWGDKYHTDWQKEFMGQQGKVYNGNISISGGISDKTTFFINASYFETGTVLLAEPDDKEKRINTKLLVNHRGLNDRLEITASFAFNKLNVQNRGLDPDAYLVNAPNQPAYNDDGTLYWLPNNASFVNPLRGKYAVTQNKGTDLISNLQTHYRFLPDFDVIIDVGYSRNTADQFQTYSEKYLNPYAANTYKNRVLAGDSYSERFIAEPRINYVTARDKHSLTALLGASCQIDNFAGDDLELRDFPTELFFRNYAVAPVKYSVNSNTEEIKRASVYTRVSYDYDAKYIFSGIIRRDGSSIFDKGNRYGNFWSLAGAWVFSGEDFVHEKLGFLNYGKLKISHGLTGNDNVTPFQYITAYAAATYPYEGHSGLFLKRVANPQFTWEKTRKSEIYLGLAFLKNRLQVTGAYYLHTSNSLIGNQPIASQAGVSSYKDILQGVVLRSRGVELDMVSTNIRNRNFQWLTTLTLTVPDNSRITSFPGLENTSYATQFKAGESIHITRLYKFTGINPENGVPVVEDVDLNGTITAAGDKQFLEDTDPDYYGGLHNSFRYKNWQLDVFFYFEKRPFQEGYLKTYYYPAGYIGKNIPRSLANNYWTPENPGGTLPGLTTSTTSTIGQAYWNYYTESSAVYADASYIRLKNVSLAYTLPKPLTGKLKAKDIRLYVRGENLWTLTKFDEWDPETLKAIPPFRTITAGVTLSF